MSKEIRFDQAGRGSILKGVNTLANADRVTLGPKGRNVILEKSFGSPGSACWVRYCRLSGNRGYKTRYKEDKCRKRDEKGVL